MATLLNPPNPRPIEQQLSRMSHDRGLRPRTWVVALVLTVLAGMWATQYFLGW